MGATFVTEEVPAATKLDRWWTERLKELRDENGHRGGYSGDFQTCDGLDVTSKTFPDEDEANDWLVNNTEKWGNARAVKVQKAPKAWYWIVGAWCAE